MGLAVWAVQQIFLLCNNIHFSAAQRVINQDERRSLLKVKNQMFPAIIDAPTGVIFENICPDLVLNQEPLDLRSNAFPLGYLGMWFLTFNKERLSY